MLAGAGSVRWQRFKRAADGVSGRRAPPVTVGTARSSVVAALRSRCRRHKGSTPAPTGTSADAHEFIAVLLPLPPVPCTSSSSGISTGRVISQVRAATWGSTNRIVPAGGPGTTILHNWPEQSPRRLNPKPAWKLPRDRVDHLGDQPPPAATRSRWPTAPTRHRHDHPAPPPTGGHLPPAELRDSLEPGGLTPGAARALRRVGGPRLRGRRAKPQVAKCAPCRRGGDPSLQQIVAGQRLELGLSRRTGSSGTGEGDCPTQVDVDGRWFSPPSAAGGRAADAAYLGFRGARV